MTFGDINAIEQVAVKVIVKLAVKRFAKVLSAGPQDLVRSKWRPVWLPFHDRLPVLRRWCEVWMSVEVPLLKLDGFDVHGLNLLEVVLVI